MSARTVTPAEAQEMLKTRRCGTDGCACVRHDREDLAETVASEPDRIAAAVKAESALIYRAATAALADYLAADDALLDAIGRRQVRDEYDPLIAARLRRLEYLRDLLAPEVTP